MGLRRKNFFALILSVLLVIYSFAGCADTRYMMTANDEKVDAGIYLYYALNTFSFAVGEIQKEYPDFDPTKKKDVEEAVFNGQKLVNYVSDEAVKRVSNYITSINKFEELGLELTEDEQLQMDDYVAQFWDLYADNMAENGISKSSLIECVKVMYYNQSIFNYYYKIGAAEGVTEEDIRDFYIDNMARVKYIPFYFQNASGATVIGDAKEPIRQRANEYLEKVQGGMEMDEAIDDFVSVSVAESSAYVSSSVEQSEADALTATDPDTGETTTAEATTTTEPTTTVTDEIITTVVTSTYIDEEGSTLSVTYTETVTTTSSTEPTTTTTTAPYQYEQTIARVTTTEPADVVLEYDGGVTTAAEEPTYYPNKTVNEAIFAATDYSKPFLVEADDAVYLVMRYDITERMTEDDLWTEENIDNTVVAAYQMKFFDRIEEWARAVNIKRNNAAFNRYKIWKFIISSEIGY